MKMTGEYTKIAHGYEIRTRYSPREERYQTALYRDGDKVWHSFEDTFEEAVSLAEEMAKHLNKKHKSHDKAFELIAAERAAQDAQWDGQTHSTEKLLTYAIEQIRDATFANRLGWRTSVKKHLVKLAALAVAALENMEEKSP